MAIFEVAATVAAIAIPASAVIITVIKTKAGTKDNQADNKTLRSMDREVCPLHDTFEMLMTEMRNDIKQILRKIGE